MDAIGDLTIRSLKDYPKEVILKDGTGVTLRPLREGDEDRLYRLYSRFSENDRWFFDHDVSDFERIKQWTKTRDSKRAISIVALLEGAIIANAILIMKYYGSRSHIGEIIISVEPSFRERYLGTWMLLDLINLAISMGLEILVMQLVEGRDSYLMRSVQKMEFTKEALFRDYVRDQDGNPYDLVIMVKRLHRGLACAGR